MPNMLDTTFFLRNARHSINKVKYYFLKTDILGKLVSNSCTILKSIQSFCVSLVPF